MAVVRSQMCARTAAFCPDRKIPLRGDDIVCLGFFVRVILLHKANLLLRGNRTFVH